jgi:hypothetical protein
MVGLLRLPADIEQVNAHENDEEAAEEGDRVDSASGVESLEEDGAGDDGGGREEHVVDRVDDVRGERVQGFIEVVLSVVSAATVDHIAMMAHHLEEDAADDDDAEDVCRDVGQLVVACNGQLESHAKTLSESAFCIESPRLSSRLTLIAMTETLPAKEQMVRYTNGVLLP